MNTLTDRTRNTVKMWSSSVFFLLVGLALASNTPGWKDNTEYVYTVRGRTLAGLDGISTQHSGIVLKASLRIQSRPDGKIQGLIVKPEYSQIHSELHDGWKTYIPDSELTWKTLELSGQPFQAEMKYGVFTDLIVNRDVSNWEANIIKGIMSQFQLNTNEINSTQPKNHFEPTVFRVLEDTITGNTDTLYEIKIKPRHMFRNKLWESRMLRNDGDIIEIVKDKNFTNSVELPSYFYGFAGLDNWNPATNQMGEFFIRHSMSRAFLTGNTKRYTLHNSYTVNSIMVNPTLNDRQKGSVVSVMNVTLKEVSSQFQIMEEVIEPVRLGNLVYAYEKPYAHSEVREKPMYKQTSEEIEYDVGIREKPMWRRLRRSIDQHTTDISEESYKQDEPTMSQPPESPLLPYTTGFKGKSVKYRVDIVTTVKELAQKIASEMEDAMEMLEKSSTTKLITLTSLIRIMNEEELKKTVNELYTNVEEGIKRDSWRIFLDALAESGTGPAFLTIQSLIKSDKISGAEASHIISTMSKAVRQPTFQYMKAYFELIKDPKVQSHWSLNATAILSYTDLIREVYFDRNYYRKQFPIKSFVGFRKEEAIRFVRETVIPHLVHQLHESIAIADTKKIHTYIRALGNVADPKILEAFEAYLEGDKHASQFQRFLMVVALDELAKIHPEEVVRVLFRIYQNLGETQEMRVAAVYLLINAKPTVDILQHMAAYTRVDPQEYVNAAVKSSILRAAELEGEEFYELRNAAIAAKPLLTEKTYGLQYGANYLRTYFAEKINLYYKHALKTYGSEDEYYPKGFEYILESKWGELKYEYAHVQAMISSIEQLVRVGKRQTSEYQRLKQSQEAEAEKQHQNPWSSQNIASLLNMKPELLEQLEGSFYSKGMGSMFRMLSFDNRSIEMIPELIRRYEEKLEQGKQFNFIRFTNRGDMALSFPTEMGLPFLFAYDVPTIMQAKGNVQVSAVPKFSESGKINIPDSVSVRSDVYVTLTSKIQGRLSFSTPFDHQQYSAGYDKHWQVHFLLKTAAEVNVKDRKLKIEIEPVAPNKNTQLFHYSTWPYTSRSDIMDFDHSQDGTHIIKPKQMRRFDELQSLKYTGFATRWMMEHERQDVDSINLGKILLEKGPLIAFLALWNDASVQYAHTNVSYLPAESFNRKIVMKLQYHQKYSGRSEFESSENFESENRDSIIDSVGARIHNAKVEAVHASVDFQGDKNIKYTVSGAFAKSNVDPKSRLAVIYKRTSAYEEDKPYEANLEAENYIPNTGALDFNDALETEPEMATNIKVTFGQIGGDTSKIQTDFSFRRSQERKQYLKQLPMYSQCKHEMREGNKQLPSCVNMTMEANLLDHVKVHVHHENIPERWIHAAQVAVNYIEARYWLTIEESSRLEKSIAPNQVVMEARFHPDLKFVNVTVQSKGVRILIPVIPVNYMARRVFVVHPVFHLKNRVISGALGLKTFRPFCVADKTQVSTFNNLTYPADISQHWTVMLQYVPKIAQQNKHEYVEEQLASQINNYVVLVRQNPESPERKDVKMTVSSPETEFKSIDITMTPKPQVTSGAKAVVAVNGREIEVSEEKSYDVKDGYIQIYALPSGEAKVEVSGVFYVIYDGERVRLTVTNGEFRNSLRGLCGQFNDQISEDLFTPQNCIARDYHKFVQSYEVEGHAGQAARKELTEDRLQCVRKQTPSFVDVVPHWSAEDDDSSEGYQFFQTKYVYEGDQICFTTRPVVTCRRQYQASGYITKKVPVHCVTQSNVSQLWKNQIDKGSSPDFSHKEEHKRIQMQVPLDCSQ